MAYDFKRVVYGAILFTASMYMFLLIVASMGANYDKDVSDIGGGMFDEDNWELGSEDRYDDAAGLRDASVTASVTNLDIPSSSKSIFEQVTDFVLMPFTLLFTVVAVIFHVPAPIMWTFGTLLMIELVLIVWRLLKQGD